MKRRRIFLALGLIALASAGALRFSVYSTTQYSTGTFSFLGPPSLEEMPDAAPDTLGRRDPEFRVSSYRMESAPDVSSSEVIDIDGRSAWLAKGSAMAPGKGGRDHLWSIYLPGEKVGIAIYFRTYDDALDTGWWEHLEDWRSQKWAQSVIDSLSFKEAG